MKKADGLKSAELAAALDLAMAGRPADLYRRLELQSGLPGPRVNMLLAQAFAVECSRRGHVVDEVLFAMTELDANDARGASGKEFVVVCGVLGVGARAGSDLEETLVARALSMLEARADDLRFRVRDAVPLALASIGKPMGIALCERLAPWLDRYFHAASIVRALAEPPWLDTIAQGDAGPALALLDGAFQLAHDAPRSAFRYPGHKALVEALSVCPKAIARRLGQPMFELYTQWATRVKVPMLRDAIVSSVSDTQIKKALGHDIAKVKGLVEQSKPPLRDPTRLRAGMRSRGKKRGD